MPSAGIYRANFNVIIRVGNLPSASFDFRTMYIMVCTGNQTSNTGTTVGVSGFRFVFPDNVTTGTTFSVSGVLFIIASSSNYNSLTLNISNEGATESESLFIDYVSLHWEKITSSV